MMDKLDEELCFNKGMEKTILKCLTCFRLAGTSRKVSERRNQKRGIR